MTQFNSDEIAFVPKSRAADVLRAVHHVHRRIARERDRDALLRFTAEQVAAALDEAACCIARCEGGERGEVVERYEAGDPVGAQRLGASLATGLDVTRLAREAREAPPDADGRGVLAFAMECDTRVHGVMLVAAKAEWSSDAEVLGVLRELAEDLAFALCKLERLADADAQTAQLRESERRYRMLADSVSDVIWVLDLDTSKFTYVSPSVLRLRGYSPEEVLAQEVSAALTPASQQHLARVLPGRVAEFLAGVEQVHVDPIDQPRKDGTIVRTETVTRLLRDAASGHVFTYGVSRDLSDHDRAQALQAQASHIAENVPGLMHSFEVRADGTARMPFATAAALDVFGLAPQQLAQNMDAWAANVHPEDLTSMWARAEARARAMAPWHDEYRYFHPTKGLRWLEGWSSPTRGEDGALLWHGFVMDVTERRQGVARVEQLSRLYRALSDTNEAIARRGEERALLQRVCDIVTGLGEIRIATVSLLDEGGDTISSRAVAGAAVAAGPLALRFPVGPRPSDASSLIALSFRAGATRIENDYPAAARREGWKTPADVSHNGAAIAVPLRLRGETVGILSIGATERGYFDEEVVELVEAMARNLSLGLDHAARERELRESEERFRQIFELAPVGVAWIDSRSGKFLRVNQRQCDILGYTREELLTKRWQDLTHPDHLEGDLGSYGAMLAGEQVGYAREKRYLRKDGTEVWAQISVTRAWHEGEAPTFHVAVVEDITARKRAEQAMRASEERYRTLLDSLGDVVFTTSTSGAISFVSRAIERFGWTPEQLIGTKLQRVIHPEDLAEVLRARGQSLSGTALGPVEYRLVDASGKPRPVRSSSQPLMEDGKIVGTYGVLVDLTHQRETEEHLRFAQKMEAVGRLAGGVAHDFNNLLSVIESYAELALEALRPDDPVRDDVSEIRGAAKRAEALTRQLLAFSRKQVLRPERLDLNVLVTRVGKMLGRLLGEDVELAFAPAAHPMEVEADPGQLEQVLMNLAINARDAMPNGGRLAIELSGHRADERRGSEPPSLRVGAYVKLTVSDTGHGMSEATRSRVFEPFFTTKPLGKGTGLGLAMAYGIVQQSGGHISVRSAPDAGTTFEILLPLLPPASGEDASAPSAPPAASVRGAETVLVVEDEPAVRTIAQRILKAAGYHVLVAASGVEALALSAAHAGAIAILVTDVVMPGMNGKQLADRLVQTRPDTKVLFMSGYADEALGERGVRSGSLQLLDKPFTSDGLTRKVRRVLDGA